MTSLFHFQFGPIGQSESESVEEVLIRARCVVSRAPVTDAQTDAENHELLKDFFSEGLLIIIAWIELNRNS